MAPQRAVIAVGGRRTGTLGAVPRSYVQELRTAGADPLIVSPDQRGDDFASTASGLLLTGGDDVDPLLYGDRDDKSASPDRLRDASELRLLRSAFHRQMPILAICRGLQLVNVAFGGSLDRSGVGHGHSAEWEQHPVRITAHSAVATWTGTRCLASCSSHHAYRVSTLGRGLRAGAWAPDGTIEAIEIPSHPNLICVQWHPEDTAPTDPYQRRIFQKFVDAATAYALAAMKSASKGMSISHITNSLDSS